ncbi:MAG: DUF4912 domain-containing protein [Myxococcales bacterium]|nr:MAG: DUF4912 domain-containing protein [Myxococcales bacterium]
MLPFSYNEDRLMLLPVDPGMAYAYWDYSAETWSLLEKSNRPLRLKLQTAGNEATYEVDRRTKNYFFRGLAGRTGYRLVISAMIDGEEKILQTSREIRMPANSPSENGEVLFARIPFMQPLPKSRKGLPRRRSLKGLPAGGIPTFAPASPTRYLAGYESALVGTSGTSTSLAWRHEDQKGGK